MGHKTGLITYEFETKMFFNYSRGIKLLADVMDVEGGRVFCLDEWVSRNWGLRVNLLS